MSEPRLVLPGSGEVVGDAPDRRVEILCEQEAVHATWSRFGPFRAGADLHIHRRHADLFYVLAGELTVMLGRAGEDVAVPAGTLVRVPALVVHGFRNGSDSELRYLNLHAPGVGFADYLRAIRDGGARTFDQEPPPPDGVRPATDAVIGGDGFAAHLPGRRVALLADVPEIGIAEIRIDPGGTPPQPHVHRRHAVALYVLEGELALTTGERPLRASAGSWLEVPPGVPHAVSSPAADPARYLELHAPGCGFGSFVRALSDGRDEELAAARTGFDRQPAS